MCTCWGLWKWKWRRTGRRLSGQVKTENLKTIDLISTVYFNPIVAN